MSPQWMGDTFCDPMALCFFSDWLGCATRREQRLRFASQQTGIVVGVRYLRQPFVWMVDRVYKPESFNFELDGGRQRGFLTTYDLWRPVFVPVAPGRHTLVEVDPRSFYRSEVDPDGLALWSPLRQTVDVRPGEVVAVLVTPSKSRLFIRPGYRQPSARVWLSHLERDVEE